MKTRTILIAAMITEDEHPELFKLTVSELEIAIENGYIYVSIPGRDSDTIGTSRDKMLISVMEPPEA